MADALSDNFCSLCGLSFYRFGSDNLNIKTSLASADVENSGESHSINYKLFYLFYNCSNVDACSVAHNNDVWVYLF